MYQTQQLRKAAELILCPPSTLVGIGSILKKKKAAYSKTAAAFRLKQ